MLNDTSSALALLRSRKSASAKAMTEPGPTAAQLQEILSIAVRVPDHGKLSPWRFILIEGPARTALGEIAARRWRALRPEDSEATLAYARGLLLRAPAVLVVVSTAKPHAKIPEWEQVLSAGAVCQNILLAAAATGIGAQWNTDWVAYDPEMTAAMGVADGEKVAGLIYLGTPAVPLEDRPRPDTAALLTRWEAK